MRIRFGPAAALVALAAVGCGDNTGDQVAEMNKSNIQRLSNIYAGFQNGMGNRGPKDEAEFKDFIKNYAPDKLSWMKIDPNKLDALFTSERDNQPFKVRYGVGGGRGSVDPVVFETGGKDGKKQIGYTGGRVDDVDDAESAKLFANKPAAAAAARPGSGGGAPPGADAGRPGGSGRPAGAPAGPPGS